MKRSLFVVMLSWACVVQVKAMDANNPPGSVVEVLVTAQRFDAFVPWKKSKPESRAGYAVVIAEGRLITTEDLVRNAVLVEIRRPGAAARTKANIVVADPRVNAALLSAPTDGLLPVGWSEPVKTGAKIQLIQYDEAGQLQSGDGRITGIEVAALPSVAQSILTFEVLTDLKLARIGTPALHDGNLVGLVMQYNEGSQTSEVLPSAILRRFVEAADHPPYRGVAVAGLLWSPLLEPAKRQYYGLPDDDKGVLVLRTIPGSCTSGALQSGDVILSWDGQVVDSQGYYNDPDFGRLMMVHQISGRRHPGETITITRWRNHKKEDVQVKLDAYDDSRALVPMNIEGKQAEYLVEGGLLLRELSADYLLANGAQWMMRGNPRLVNLYLTRAQAPEKPGDRIVILSRVLPHPITSGYQAIRDEVITRVNGKPISNIQDVFAIREQDGGITRVTTQTAAKIDLVLDKKSLDEANRQISTLYGITRLEHRNPPAPVGPLISTSPR